MVQLRLNGYGQALVGPPAQLLNGGVGGGKWKRTSFMLRQEDIFQLTPTLGPYDHLPVSASAGGVFVATESVVPASSIPRIHLRVKVTDEGDMFEDIIPWDVRDPYLKDPETFAISLGNEFGLDMQAVEELTRSINEQLRNHAATKAGSNLRLILSPEEQQAQAAKEARQYAAEHDPHVPSRKRELGAPSSTYDSDAAWRQYQQQQAPGVGPPYGGYPPPGGYPPMEGAYAPPGMYPYPYYPPPHEGGWPEGGQAAPRPSLGKRKKPPTPKFEIPPGGLDETMLPIKKLLGNGREADGIIDHYLDNPPLALDQVVDALRAESIRMLRGVPAEFKVVQGMSCHGCKHPMDASVLICPRNIGSHSLCGVHFQRFHSMTDRDAKHMWEIAKNDPAAAATMGPFPVCLACSMSCPCKLCQRQCLRRALDVISRFINVSAGRDAEYDGIEGPVMAEGVTANMLMEERNAKRVSASDTMDAPSLSYGRRKGSGIGDSRPSDASLDGLGGGGSGKKKKQEPGSKKKKKQQQQGGAWQDGLGPYSIPQFIDTYGASPSSSPANTPPLTPPPQAAPRRRPPRTTPMVNLDLCVTCQQEVPGEVLLLCTNCPRALHGMCLRRPDPDVANLTSSPKDWLCEICRDEVDEAVKLLVPTAAEEGRRDIERDCKHILDTLLKHELAGAFCEPVDLEYAADYLDYVKEPIDLRQIRQRYFSGRARKGAFFHVPPFIIDVRRVWHNCRMYNEEGTLIHALGELLERIFEENVRQRIVPQLSPEALVEMNEKTAELDKEREETLEKLRKKGKLPPVKEGEGGRGGGKSEEVAAGEGQVAAELKMEGQVEEQQQEEQPMEQEVVVPAEEGGGVAGGGVGGRRKGVKRPAAGVEEGEGEEQEEEDVAAKPAKVQRGGSKGRGGGNKGGGGKGGGGGGGKGGKGGAGGKGGGAVEVVAI